MNHKKEIEVKPEVLEAVKKAAVEGRLSCNVARELAETLGVPPVMIGRACDELQIKINACELGCF
ncbi:MAG: hypothetical protein GX295_01015 [Syntrophomonadaceae bacterium]|nr:hypothetical protein [Syntrophomonadaceae bacterium]